MDDIDEELIRLLCTKIGMLMEDHSTKALTIGNRPIEEKRRAIDELAQATTKIKALAVAAQIIDE